MCTTGGNCKSSDKIYALINARTNKLYRLTFSKTLAEYMTQYDPEYSTKTFRYVLGHRLKDNEASQNGLYAIVSALPNKNDLVLRISMSKEIAELYKADGQRVLHEIWLTE